MIIGTVKGYTLTSSQEQQKQIQGCNCMKCLSAKIRLAMPDANGDLFPFFDECNKCSEASLARALKRTYAEWYGY